MTLGLKIVCALYGVLMGLLGVRWWFSFDGIAAEWFVQPLSLVGVNNLTADLGSLFLGSAIMIGLGLRPGRSAWLLPVAVLMAIAAAGRLLAYTTVGYTPDALVPLVFEIASCGVLVLTHQRMSRPEPAQEV